MIWAGFAQSTLCRSTEIEEKVSGWCGEAYENVALPLPGEGGGREEGGCGERKREEQLHSWLDLKEATSSSTSTLLPRPLLLGRAISTDSG